MNCFHCGDFINLKSNDTVICKNCSLYYCGRCGAEVKVCHSCGGALTPAAETDVAFFSPSSIFAEIMYGKKREEKRQKIEITCAFTISEKVPSERKRKYRTKTRDVSRSGVCIYTSLCLSVGQKLNFEDCSAFPGRSIAEVRWVKPTKGLMFMAGLKFS